MCEWQRSLEDGNTSVSKAPRDGLATYYWRMGVGGGRRSFLGLRLVSAIWYCLLYQGLLKPVYTQVLKEGLGPKSELKPMGVTYKPICMSEPYSVSAPPNM